MTFPRALQFLQRNRSGLLIAGMLVLILGLRIYAGVRCLAEIPQGDDGYTFLWLQQWSQGIHDWSQVWRLHNHAHPMELYYLSQLGEYLLNGYWDGRIDFLVGTLIHTVYAGVVFWTFGGALARRDRWWIYLFVLGLFAVPFGGYRIAWGLLWPDSAVMMFALPAIYLAAYRRQSWAAVTAICLLPRLARTFPFVLRDWETIYAKVTPGHDHRIESHDANPAGWIAFSEPLESGRLTPLVVGFCQSGKLLCLGSLGLLALVLYLRWLEGASFAGETTPALPGITVP